MNKYICIVGAGAVGLSCALKIIEIFGDQIQINIIAEQFLQQTTSYGSAGLWEPYQIAGTPDDNVYKWGKISFDHFLELYHSKDCGKSGAQLITAYSLFEENEDYSLPIWKDIVLNFNEISSQELLKMKLPKKFVKAFTFSTFVIDQKYYLSQLTNKLRMLGVKFIQKRIDGFDELHEYDAILNCSGIGAFKLLNDMQMYPIRGQVIRIKAPWIKNVWMFGQNYVIPNIDNVVVGGTQQKGNWSINVNLDDSENIIKKVSELFPSIQDAPIETIWAGLRPGRTPLRLESEIINIGPQKMGVPIIHCYGHGGSGITLAMGCADEVVREHLIPIFETSQNNQINNKFSLKQKL